MIAEKRTRESYHEWSEISKTQLSIFKGTRSTSGENEWDRNRSEYYDEVVMGKSKTFDSEAIVTGTIVHEALLMNRYLAEFCVVYPPCCYSHESGKLNSSKAKLFKEYATKEVNERNLMFVIVPEKFVIKSGNGISKKPEAQRWFNAAREVNPSVKIISKNDLQEFEAAMSCLNKSGSIAEYVITNDQAVKCSNVITEIENSEFSTWINSSNCEDPICWSETVTTSLGSHDFKFRCCPDFVSVDDDIVLAFDLKVTANEKPAGFAKQVKRFSYWLQDAHYTVGLQSRYPNHRIDYRFVAVNPDTQNCGLYSLNPHSRDVAQEERMLLIKDLALCYQSQDWTNEWQKTEHQLVLSHFDF